MVAADTSHKLLEFERLFKNRYTEHDSDYQKALQGQRFCKEVYKYNISPQNATLKIRSSLYISAS